MMFDRKLRWRKSPQVRLPGMWYDRLPAHEQGSMRYRVWHGGRTSKTMDIHQIERRLTGHDVQHFLVLRSALPPAR